MAQGGLSNVARDYHRKAYHATHGDGDSSARCASVAQRASPFGNPYGAAVVWCNGAWAVGSGVGSFCGGRVLEWKALRCGGGSSRSIGLKFSEQVCQRR